MLGRLVPSTGDITLVTLPTPNARPYGLKQDSTGTVWVSYNGAGKLGRMDPVTMAVREYPLPDPATRSRRLAITSDDMVWFVNSSLGRLGRLNPKTGEVKEWRSPSGARSHPYAIEVIDDVIWYNESGQRPDALVRFDPEDRAFPELGDPVRRRHHPPHAQDPGRQPGDPPDQHQPHRPGDHRQAADVAAALAAQGAPDSSASQWCRERAQRIGPRRAPRRDERGHCHAGQHDRQRARERHGVGRR